ncbi:ribokinase [Allobacillus sp. GCM10007491]|uniref:Ribokinase n=1 Tax=Allobacillus saliphilus TaxID=2912308 RepID=A0A941CU67_9BACI|nr:ribokinase [Allobacillus saliphilus]MBR7552631.1 ribokinase [Allobacillus saliphilus]
MNVLVIGSINMDLVLSVKDIVKPGETTSSTSYTTNFGGKGSNQAVACRHLGANVSFIGSVGADEFGEAILTNYDELGIETSGISKEGQTGIAMIQVNEAGENSIVLVPGANYQVSKADIDRHRSLIEACDIVLMQLEIPIETVEYAIEQAKTLGKKVVLNPAPANEISREALRQVDLLTPNETELAGLSGLPVHDLEHAEAAAKMLLDEGVGEIVVTLGRQGSLLVTKEESFYLEAKKVEVVDTTGAGDAYNAALVTALSDGLTIKQAMKLATLVAGYTVSVKGAQPKLLSMNYFLEQVEND